MVQIFTIGQKLTFEFCGTNYIFTISAVTVEKEGATPFRALLSESTSFVFEAKPNDGIKLTNQSGNFTVCSTVGVVCLINWIQAVLTFDDHNCSEINDIV